MTEFWAELRHSGLALPIYTNHTHPLQLLEMCPSRKIPEEAGIASYHYPSLLSIIDGHGRRSWGVDRQPTVLCTPEHGTWSWPYAGPGVGALRRAVRASARGRVWSVSERFPQTRQAGSSYGNDGIFPRQLVDRSRHISKMAVVVPEDGATSPYVCDRV